MSRSERCTAYLAARFELHVTEAVRAVREGGDQQPPPEGRERLAARNVSAAGDFNHPAA